MHGLWSAVFLRTFASSPRTNKHYLDFIRNYEHFPAGTSQDLLGLPRTSSDLLRPPRTSQDLLGPSFLLKSS